MKADAFNLIIVLIYTQAHAPIDFKASGSYNGITETGGKTMKKRLLAIVCILAALAFSGCAKEGTVVGQWQTIGRTDEMKLLDVQEETWVFADDGTVVRYWDGEEVTNGRYVLDKGTVSIAYFGESGPVYTLEENELKQGDTVVMVRHDEK